ncbi:GM13536 [Drosophila sechellia]|uniref:GM13536 n=1 Tax=Drosophila sechellia TaxID=7238 RepID=B4IMF4_DROSE|nr:GM13536 [Drosophila sechellia]
MGITVDNQKFHAPGRSKKIARRNVAVKVCNSLFGTNFAYDDTAKDTNSNRRLQLPTATHLANTPLLTASNQKIASLTSNAQLKEFLLGEEAY